MTTTQQPEILKLRLACEQHIAICKKFGPEGFHLDIDPHVVLSVLGKLAELESQLEAIGAGGVESLRKRGA